MNTLKKNIKISFLIVLIAVGLISCQKTSLARQDMFGNNEASPLKKKIAKSHVAELQNVFGQIYELYKPSMVFITTEQMVRVLNPFFNDPWML